MNKGKASSSDKPLTKKENKVGDLFPSTTLEEYAGFKRDHNDDDDDDNDDDEGEEDKVCS